MEQKRDDSIIQRLSDEELKKRSAKKVVGNAKALSTITKENPSNEEVVQMFKAFAENFSSLSAVNATDVAEMNIKAIEDACRDEEASQGGLWLAKVESYGGRIAIIPYSGKRRFVVHRQYAMVDYSARPSRAHADSLIAAAPEGAVVEMSDYWRRGGCVIVPSIEVAEALAQFCATLVRKPLIATATNYWDEGFSFEIEQWGSSSLAGYDLSQGDAWFNMEPEAPIAGSENMAEWLDAIWKEWRKKGGHKITEPPMWLIDMLGLEREFAQKPFKATIPLAVEEYTSFVGEAIISSPQLVSATSWDGKCISTSSWKVVKEWMNFIPDTASVQFI